MGTGFTVDTAVKVAKYGISSVISLVDDVLMEQLRESYCKKENLPYEKISEHDTDARARRIEAYLNLIQYLVQRDFEKLRASSFETGSDVCRYFELLPNCELKRNYFEMLNEINLEKKDFLQECLRSQMLPGSIDVNIMTKLDRAHFVENEQLDDYYRDAHSALRGYAKSNLDSAVVFSAGLNRKLLSYATQFKDFHPNAEGYLKKRIIIKVSDYRSALIQGKYLLKHGLWVSEFRVESGINCGGHAFIGACLPLGPILEEFKNNRDDLLNEFRALYYHANTNIANISDISSKLNFRITAQGGIGTADEQELLLNYYKLDATGWGTPFLLVPEVTNVDDYNLQKLINASPQDIELSDSSPLGIKYWNLINSSSEEAKLHRIAEGKPGSPCMKGYLAANTEFSDQGLCEASRNFQKQKLEQIYNSDFPAEEKTIQVKKILGKSCICNDLGGGAVLKNHIKAYAPPAVCCGPNIINFKKIFSLEEMLAHVYGKKSVFDKQVSDKRPHMFIKELALYLDYLRDEVTLTQANFNDFKDNILSGINYYKKLFSDYAILEKEKFLLDLELLSEQIKRISYPMLAA